MTKRALVIVDVQNDFCPGGSLAVPEGDEVVPVLNRYIEYFSERDLPIYASRDWHPEWTKHFEEWPPHCVRGTEGARFHPDLDLPEGIRVLSKGTDPEKPGYSVFESRDAKGKSFSEILEEVGAEELYVGGLATDFCVKNTVLDALDRGFGVKLLTDAIRGVYEDGTEEAMEEMLQKGAEAFTLEDLGKS